jgi:hypothetical protein
MILRRRVALGGVQLDELDERIVISGIEEGTGAVSVSSVETVNADGKRVTRKKRDSLDVAVKFLMNIRKDEMAERALLLEKINGWAANGGNLTVGHRPDRRLVVFLNRAPGGGEMYNWTDEFELGFQAMSVPYWEDAVATSVSSGVTTGGTLWLDVPGNTKTVVDVDIQNMSGTNNRNVWVNVAGQEIRISGTPIAAGRTIRIAHPNDGMETYLKITDGVRSLLAFRTGADDLVVSPGSNWITFGADRAVKVTVSVRGRYL